jgi:hypothetical protein
MVGVQDTTVYKCEHSRCKLKLSHTWLQTGQQVFFLIHKDRYETRRLLIIKFNVSLAGLQLLQLTE